ncbi:MAG: FkbM family methyltransferase [Rhodobacterales bacterium]|nr:FkbM family methyltransferase [Rhodobacterales bacterium]NCT13235.1 FkbM family methyltransferase [Rhodobacterales bacterium]
MTPDDRIAAARAGLVQAQADLGRALEQDRSRARGGLIRRLHEVRRMLDPGYHYVSQAGQDLIVDRLLGAKRGGTFVDIGGYDGVTGSNTLFFEQWRGWSGVLVEPVPSNLARARDIRRCPCLGLAVAATQGEADFVEITEGFTQMSGLAGSYDPAMLTRVRQDPRHRERILRVETRSLSRILTDALLPHPDFVSLDIEGGEADALAAFPFAAHRVGLWAIENNTGGPEIARIMQAAGYDLVEFAGPDEIWRLRGL